MERRPKGFAKALTITYIGKDSLSHVATHAREPVVVVSISDKVRETDLKWLD